MKRFCNYAFGIVCAYILTLTVFSISNIGITKNHNKSLNINDSKVLSSSIMLKVVEPKENTEEVVEKIEEVKDVVTEVEPVVEQVVESTPAPVEVSVPQGNTVTYYSPIDTSGYNVISSEIVNISHFGPDCNGCGAGYVATGDYVGSGRIYYRDNTFGTVRIVAADYKYPSGTILRLSYNGNVMIAIVLDRGGGIGDGKKYQIDLLTESEAKCYQLGVMYGATLEVLRLGF